MRILYPPRKHPVGAPISIDGYPLSCRPVKIPGEHARRLSDLSLHQYDLTFALESLDKINHAEDLMTREALWETAILHYFKCFGNSSSRSRLSIKKVLAGDEEGKKIHEFLRSLRNKTIAHDENYYTQSVPIAIVDASKNHAYVVDILCQNVYGITLDEANFSNLRLLILTAQAWVDEEFDYCRESLLAELNSRTLDQLLALPAPAIESKFDPESASKTRPRS